VNRRSNDSNIFRDRQMGSVFIWEAGAPRPLTASSLITLLLWVYYSSQILLFGAGFTQIYACRAGQGVAPDEHATRI